MILEVLNSEKDFNKKIFSDAFHEVIEKYKPELNSQVKNNIIQINFIDDQLIQKLNQQYRQKNKPTDVLSWSFITSDLLPHEIAGEIYISIETAQKQAEQMSLSYQDRLYFLATHGLLHVFHYTHETDEDENEMNMLTDEVLKLLKIQK